MRKTTITILSLITLAGCGRKGARSSDFDSATSAALATGAAAAQMASIPKTAHLSAVELGHQLDRHDMIFGGVATQYKAADSVLVSAKGLYVVAGSVVSARIRLKNATLDSTSAKIGVADSAGASYAGLRFAPGPKWTKASYLVEVFLDGKFQMAKDFTYTP